MKSLYVTYDGLLDPLGQSQVLPYLRRLHAAGHEFVILSFEKTRPAKEVDSLESELRSLGIRWDRLSFQHGAGGFLQRVLRGALRIRRLVREFQPEIVHLRGFVPAMMNTMSLQPKPHVYDFRSFAVEEWAECGKIRSGSLLHRVFRLIDRRAVASAAGLVVLEQSAADLMRRIYTLQAGVPLHVIRTSTDVTRYPRKQVADGRGMGPDRLRLVCLGGARYPYRPDLALRLVRELTRLGFPTSIDFINEGDHQPLAEAALAAGVAIDQVRIFAAKHADVPALLGEYDCGLFLCDTSPWRRVCSPTKLGEYLSAGLPVIALPGIDVIEAYAASTRCVTTVAVQELVEGLQLGTVQRLSEFVRAPGIASVCQDLAQHDFDLQSAGDKYVALYEQTARFIGQS